MTEARTENGQPPVRTKDEWQALFSAGDISDQHLYELTESLRPKDGEQAVRRETDGLKFGTDEERPELIIRFLAVQGIDTLGGPAEGVMYDFVNVGDGKVKVILHEPWGDYSPDQEERSELVEHLLKFL